MQSERGVKRYFCFCNQRAKYTEDSLELSDRVFFAALSTINGSLGKAG